MPIISIKEFDKYENIIKKFTHINYRPDIDGLRAFSVFFLIGYYTFPEIFKTGFIEL